MFKYFNDKLYQIINMPTLATLKVYPRSTNFDVIIFKPYFVPPEQIELCGKRPFYKTPSSYNRQSKKRNLKLKMPK